MAEWECMDLIDAGELDFRDLVRPGETVAWGQISAEPRTLTAAFAAQCAEIEDLGLFLGMSLYESLPAGLGERCRVKVVGGAAVNHLLAAPGRLEVVPCRLSAIPDLIASRAIPVDVALIAVAPPDAKGMCNLGLSADYMGDAIRAARLVIAEVNPAMPRTRGDTAVPAGRIDLFVRATAPLLAAPPRQADPAAAAVAANVARLIPDGATLQIGIGAVPDAVLAALGSKRDLGVHSGLLSDGVMELIEAGVVTNRLKEIDPGISTTAVIYGSERLYAWADGRADLRVRSARYTHGPAALGALWRLHAINSAMEVDLTGQVNGETADGRHLGQIGGQVDFVEAGARAPDGRAIIALPATARRGTRSRIVARLADGVVTSPRCDADVVVTEHGIAELRGLSLQERAQRLIAVAHPDFRPALAQAAEHLV